MEQSRNHRKLDVEDGFELAETRRTLPIALLRAREAVMDRFRPMLHANDITEQQWRVIRILFELGEADATKLAELACILPPSLTRMLRTLEARGFIVVRKDPTDGRKSLIAITTEGRAFINLASRDSAAIYAQIEALLGADRLQHLLNELEFVLDRLSGDSLNL